MTHSPTMNMNATMAMSKNISLAPGGGEGRGEGASAKCTPYLHRVTPSDCAKRTTPTNPEYPNAYPRNQ